MSTAHHEAHAAAAHDVSDHHGFDGEPARALPADEPPTPNWVPALGLAVFVVAGVTCLAMSSDDGATGQAAPASARPAAAAARPAAAEARPAQAGVRPAPQPAARPAGPEAGAAAETLRAAAAERERAGGAAAPGPANLRKLTPQEVEQVRKRLDARQKDGAPAPAK